MQQEQQPQEPQEIPQQQQPYYNYPTDESKGFGIAAIICTFFATPLGLVFGIIALSKGKKFEQTTGYQSGGKTLGLVSTILSSISLGLFLICVLFAIILAVSSSSYYW